MELERVIIVGAGPCGLAIAQQLRTRHDIDALVLDRAGVPVTTWRGRYDGFRLNTCGFWSHLPGQRIPLRHGRWPGREAMVDYFDNYIRRHDLRLRLETEVLRIDKQDRWVVSCDDVELTADAVVVATGNYRVPLLPQWPGIHTFTGSLTHSVAYRNAWPYQGQDVIVVGSGNSAADIAVQLADNVASRVRMSIRTPPQLVRRSTVGVPPDAFALLSQDLPPSVIDRLGKLMRNITFGDVTLLGLPDPPKGIYTSKQLTGRIPTLAEALVRHIRDGRISIIGAVESFDHDTVRLSSGVDVTADAVIAATGFRPGLEDILGHLNVVDGQGKPLVNGAVPALPGLWFAGFAESFTGPLRSFRRQAPDIAAAVATQVLTATTARR